MPHPLPVIAHGYLIVQTLVGTPELKDMKTIHCVTCSADPAEDAIAIDFASAYVHLMENVSDTVKMGGTRVTKLNGTSSGFDFVTPSSGTAGGHGSGASVLPLNIAKGVTWQTGLRGRSQRGRTYMPGVNSDQLVSAHNRTLVAGQVTAWQEDLNEFLAALAAFSPAIVLQVLSRVGAGHVTRVVSARANPNAVEQRRRFEPVPHH